jgi:hypothetical protein
MRFAVLARSPIVSPDWAFERAAAIGDALKVDKVIVINQGDRFAVVEVRPAVERPVELEGLAEREFRSFWEGQRATVPLNEPARARDEQHERVLRAAFFEGWRRRGLFFDQVPNDEEWRDAPVARSE